MKEVLIWKVGCHGHWMPSWAGEVGEMLDGKAHATDLVKVIYDNGQLCTFKRKPTVSTHAR